MKIFLFLLALLTVFNYAVDSKSAKRTKLKIIIKKQAEACTRKTEAGDVIKVHFEGRKLETKKVFDTSYPNNSPFKFLLGKNRIMKGWDQGLTDMCVGEIRTLIVPPHLGYNREIFPRSIVDPNETLVFDIELLAIWPKATLPKHTHEL